MIDSNVIRDRASDIGQRARAVLDALSARGRRFQNGVGLYLQNLSGQPELRFRTVLWAICIMFIGFFTLLGTNPFRMLVPGAYFQLPVEDSRDAVSLYGISVETQRPVKIERRLSLAGTPAELVTRIAFTVSRPPGLKEGRGGQKYADLEPLPALGLAIRRIWLPGDGDRLLIDLREESLRDEVDRFLSSRTNDARDHTGLRDAYFRALTASIFEQMARIRSVEYLLDGQRRDYPGMAFPLSQRHERGGG